MRIRVVGFRCHLDSEWVFTEGKIHLLKGPSGIGKSTIFAAIQWVLYSGLQHVYNNAGATNKCSVTLDLDLDSNKPKLRIYRQKRPELLRVTVFLPEGGENNYEDQVAQQVINGYFGTKEAWMACCFLQQGARSYLLSASNADKMELLNTLSFSADDPDVFLNKIDTELNRTQNEFTIKQGTFAQECERFNRDINTAGVDMNQFIPMEERTILVNQITELQVQQQQLEKEFTEYQRAKGIQSSLNDSKNNLLTTLTSIQIPKADSLTELEAELDLLQKKSNLVPHLMQAARLETELQGVEKRLREIPPITQEITDADIGTASVQQKTYDDGNSICRAYGCVYDLKTITDMMSKDQQTLEIQPKLQTLIQINQLETEYQTTDKSLQQLGPITQEITDNEIATATVQQKVYDDSNVICKTYNCSYDSKIIADEISKAQQALDLQPKLQTLLQINQLQASLNALDGPTSTDEEVASAREKIIKLQASLSILKCPHCAKPIRNINNNLVPGESEPATPGQIQDAQSQLAVIIKNRQRSLEIETLKKQLESMVKVLGDHNLIASAASAPLTVPEINKLREKITALSRVQFVEAPKQNPLVLRQIMTANTQRRTYEEKKQALIKQIKSLTQLLGDFTLPTDNPSLAKPLTLPEINKLREKITTLSRVQFVEAPKQSPLALRQIMTNNTQRKMCEDKEKNIKEELSKLQQLYTCEEKLDPVALQQRMSAIKTEITSVHQINERHRVLSQQFDDVITKLSGLSIDESVAQRLNDTRTNLTESKQKMVTCTKIDELMTRQKTLEEQRALLEKLHKDLTNCHRLKGVALEVECHTLQSTVDSINLALAEMGTQLFDEPISISLQLFKTLKTKDRVKPSVNVAISYRGGEYDNVNQLSGGEGDRISLAITLALARISSCPLLLLDECLSALDGQLKEASLKVMRRTLGDTKTVIIVSHDSVEGYYDSITTLEK